MAFYYVKSGGTATGDAGRYTTQQTGSFAGLGVGGYYDNIIDGAMAATTAPGEGDFILVSDVHFHDYGNSTKVYQGDVNNFLYIISVSDTAIDQESFGAEERTVLSGSGELRFVNKVSCFSMTFKSGDDISLPSTPCNLRLSNCLMAVDTPGASRFFRLQNDSVSAYAVNTTFKFAGNAAGFFMQGSAKLEIIGCKIEKDSGGGFLLFGGANGGLTIYASGSDLSECNNAFVIENVGGDFGNDDLININFDLCAISPLSNGFVKETPSGDEHRFFFTRCGDSASNAEFQYYKDMFGGSIENTSPAGTNIFRNESEPYTETGTKVSYEVITRSTASAAGPVYFDLTTRYSELSTASTDTLRVYLASTDTLTDQDVWCEVVYPDGISKQIPNFITTRNTDIFAAGTELTTDSSSDWREGAGALTGYNEYQIDIDTSGDPGADSVPIVRVYVGKPSVTIYIDTQFDLVP